MQPEITYNQHKNGIEVKFTAKPSDQMRSDKHNIGFRYHRGKKFWYAAPVTEPQIVFANQLQQREDVTSESAILEASVKPTRESITIGNFSCVTFRVKNQTDKTMLEGYIVFEPLRAKAEALALAFASQRYGDKPQEITVYQRNHKHKVDELLCYVTGIHCYVTSREETNSIRDDGKIIKRFLQQEPMGNTIGNLSYVTFAVKIASGKARLDDYIVFEPVGTKAETLEQAFASQALRR